MIKIDLEFWFYLLSCIGFVLVAFSIRLYCEKKKEKYLLLIALGMMAIFFACLLLGILLRLITGLACLAIGCALGCLPYFIEWISDRKSLKKKLENYFDDFVFN